MTGTSDQTLGDSNQARGAANRAHRDNHSLPLREGAATPAQLAATEQALGILLRTIQNAGAGERLMRAGLTVRLMLDLGRDAAQLAQLHRIHLDADSREPPTSWGLVSWPSADMIKYGWWLPAGVHIDSKKTDSGESVRGAVWLPVLERTRPWLVALDCLDDQERGPLLGRSVPQVNRDIAAFPAWARATLGPLGSTVPNAKQLSGALAEHLAWQPTGDRTLANQMSGRDMKHSTSRSYYSSLAVPKAARHYAKAMPSPVSELSLTQQAGDPDAIAMPAFAQSALTRKDPKGAPDTMQSMLQLLRKKPDQRHRSDLANVIGAHNELVIRVWILLALSMAIRPLKYWVPGVQRIEPRTGGLVILDKNRAVDEGPDQIGGKTPGAMLGRARMVFLHPSAREMLAFYVNHLRKLARRNDIDAKSQELITKHVAGLETDALLPFLVLKHSREPGRIAARRVPPSWISKEWQELAGAPSNFGRHVVRSGLLGLVPQSAIDALLGHFDRGAEPWTNGSAFDPAAYRGLVNAFFEANFQGVAGFQKEQDSEEDAR